MNIEKVKNDVLLWSQPLFVEVCKVVHPKHPKCCTYGFIIMSKIKNDDRFTNETFDPIKTPSKFTTWCACHAKWPPKPPLILTHTCQRFGNVEQIPRLQTRMKKCPMSCARHAKRCSRPQNVRKVPRLPPATRHGHSSKNEAVQEDLRKRENLATHFVRARTVEMHMDISQGNFCARIYGEKAGGQMEHPDLTSAFNTYRNNPQCGYTVWGIKKKQKQKKQEGLWSCWGT